ncbi:MAG: hypothetical protein ACREEM_49490 [Blastocatellia bacterium]
MSAEQGYAPLQGAAADTLPLVLGNWDQRELGSEYYFFRGSHSSVTRSSEMAL